MLVFGHTYISFTVLCPFIFDYMDGYYAFGLCICFGWYGFVLIVCYGLYGFPYAYGYFWLNVLVLRLWWLIGGAFILFYDEGGDM